MKVKSERYSLQGIWQFTPEGVSEPSPIVVPGGGWRKQGFCCDAGTYERSLSIPREAEGKLVFLSLGCVHHMARYWIGNDEESLILIHEEVTSFTGQTVQLSPHVQPGETYLLRIEIRSHRDGKAISPDNFESWPIARGIFGSAELVLREPVYIRDIFIKPNVRAQSLSYEIEVVNSLPMDQFVGIHASLSPIGDAMCVYSAIQPLSVEIHANSARRVTVTDIPWLGGEESYWWPNMPYREGFRSALHMLEISLDGGATQDRAWVRFGFRQVEQVGDRFLLNGIVVNFRGDSLQIANYDKIDNQGCGDAMHTLPGFLPPSHDNPGWPKAIDNFLRLNFNLQRAHRQPWTPYMLDVCDEMGLMVMAEGASGGTEYDKDYHEMKVLTDMIVRDRNHPSIVRWSLKNEPLCPHEEYHRDLFLAARAADDTRPICIHIGRWNEDIYDPEKMFRHIMHAPGFTWMEQFITYDADRNVYYSLIDHNNAVRPLQGRPYGQGAGLWPHCATLAGGIQFATMIALVRAEHASDARPYVLLSFWASCIPGVKAHDFVTEENRYPVYGEDNLSDPWANEALQLIQTACHPLLAMDYAFWKTNEYGTPAGHFQSSFPTYEANVPIERDIVVFNDDLHGEALTLCWDVRMHSPADFVHERGEVPLSIPVGSLTHVPIRFTAPSRAGTLFLTLRVIKNGVMRFEDSSTCFVITGGEPYGYWGYGENNKIPDKWRQRQNQCSRMNTKE